ncbi:SusC/RagA family TonB-linked outer membrane protein [Robiginitalea sp. IMCC43444]|uniref:SusC/RagA family TonB-linked outer membrane protein n=1 Tax=Robiginitalea sp. IMCC43444 TaxID=3459121 RepID=UPI004043309A
MPTTLRGFLTVAFLFSFNLFNAQQKTINGTVYDSEGVPLPGVNIVALGTTTGTQTDFDGNYVIRVDNNATLRFTYLGFLPVEEAVGNRNVINIIFVTDATELQEVVVTALGLSREKKSLGYATQEVQGDAVAKVKTQNFLNSLSGRVAGLDIKSSGTLGGSANVVIRGNSSIQGNNQALFVVNGVPVNNDTGNTRGQQVGFGGYDYGNAASDLNPDDIETINVLKGAAATALYGSRAANGVIMITTKKGSKQKGLGITINSTYTSGTADRKTLPKYQKKYGAGYGPFYDGPGFYFGLADIDGDGSDDLTTVFSEDASYGAAFDPSLLIYQWNSLYPGLDTYQQATPWVAGANDPNSIWETAGTFINSISLDGGTDKSSFRLGFTNLLQEGNLPNSQLKRNTINLSTSHDFNNRLSASANITFTKNDGRGRYATGYSGNNDMTSYRQWWQVNVDVKELQQAYFATRENATWNPFSADNTSPIYWNNPYWTFYENYQTDSRNRYFGNVALTYKITDWLTALCRFTFDTYSELREERKNVGSEGVAGYTRFNRNLAEYNYDLILSIDKSLTEVLNLTGTLGYNLRRNEWDNITASTSDGLLLKDLFALSNSVGPVNTNEFDATKMVDGLYAQASLGYDSFAYLEGTYRRDRSSTLPVANNTYDYWSVSSSLIFSELVDATWISYGKLRANYGVVGNDTGPYRTENTFVIVTPPFNGGLATNPFTANNPQLKPEEQQNWEIGLEMLFLKRRIGFDITYYQAKNFNQITSVPVSNSTGFGAALLNAGTIHNQGWEVQLNATPVKLSDFQWETRLNWARNRSKVVELLGGIDNLVLGSFQEGISLNATPGEPYGILRGTDYVYHENGQPIVGNDGFYLVSETNNEVIGDINPNWTAGLYNSFTYRNINLSFLLDMQQGGDVFSLDMLYGSATGIYPYTAANNDLGNPVRDPVTAGPDSGGVILNGVQADGSPNTIRADASSYANPWGWFGPQKQHVYDAGFIKLREASLTYNFGPDLISKVGLTGASLSIIGRNLWIIDKNLPFADPEAGLSAGNIQGYQVGAYPAIREIGVNVQVKF